MAVRFLVVDDATFIRDMMKKQLRDRIPGCQVFDAADGNRAMAQLRKQRVDVILSDWEMPNTSGEELLQWVRKQEGMETTPFIMVTSRGDKDHVVQAIKSGVSDFISKPFTSDELLSKVHKQLAKIGKSSEDAFKAAKAGGNSGFGSVDALTGASPKPKAKPAPNATAASVNANSAITALTGKSSTPQKTAPKSTAKSTAKARAQLRFPKLTCSCVVRDISLQSFSGMMQRPEQLPALFEQTVIDIEIAPGDVARVNGYLSSLAAGENKVDTNIIKFSVRFVDNDPDKFEALSRFIAKNR